MKNDEIGSESQAEIERKERARRRLWYCIYFVVVGLGIVLIDPDIQYQGVRAYYVGWMMFAFGVLGFLGVNVFYDSPEDMRLDQRPPAEADDASAP